MIKIEILKVKGLSLLLSFFCFLCCSLLGLFFVCCLVVSFWAWNG